MSDPTIQTFCCHHTGKKEDMATRIMDEFNTDTYNTVCLVSSTIGILGALYQASTSLLFLSRYISLHPFSNLNLSYRFFQILPILN